MLSGHPPVGKGSDGDRDVRCDQGHVHWGRYGCAGLLIGSDGADGERRYLLQLRDDAGDGAWGIPGGAIGSQESTLDGARREAAEELGRLPDLHEVDQHIADHGGWSYTTHVMQADRPFQPRMDGSTPGETRGWGWFTPEEISGLRLHDGFAREWPGIQQITKLATVTNPAATAQQPQPAPLPPSVQATLAFELALALTAAGMVAAVAGTIAAAIAAWTLGQQRRLIDGLVSTQMALLAGVLDDAWRQRLTAGQTADASAADRGHRDGRRGEHRRRRAVSGGGRAAGEMAGVPRRVREMQGTRGNGAGRAGEAVPGHRSEDAPGAPALPVRSYPGETPGEGSRGNQSPAGRAAACRENTAVGMEISRDADAGSYPALPRAARPVAHAQRESAAQAEAPELRRAHRRGADAGSGAEGIRGHRLRD
jgi:8-oxo-dGTP pyrophosphatase MutT (NUDIX family)